MGGLIPPAENNGDRARFSDTPGDKCVETPSSRCGSLSIWISAESDGRLAKSSDVDVNVDKGKGSGEVSSVEDKPLMLDRSFESLLHLFRHVKGGLPGRPAAIVAQWFPSSCTLMVR